MAASSERMSPNRFSVSTTSKRRGSRTSSIAHESTSWWSSSTSRIVPRHLVHHLHPELRDLEHVGLVHVGHVAAAPARGLEGHPRDARDLDLVVDHGVARLAPAGDQRAAPRLAEVEPARELAHHQQVDALDHLAAQRRGVDQRREHLRRAQVREQAELLADAQQPLLGPHVDGQRVPLRAADGAQQHGAALARALQHARRRAASRGRRSTRRRSGPRREPARIPWRAATASSTRAASAVTSGPMPSPGSSRTRSATQIPLRLVGAALALVPLELVERVQVGLRARHDDVGVGAVADHAAAVLGDRDGHLALRVHAAGDRVHLVAEQLALGLGELGDRLEDGVDRADAERGGLLLDRRRPASRPSRSASRRCPTAPSGCRARSARRSAAGLGDEHLDVLVVDRLLLVREILEALEGVLELGVRAARSPSSRSRSRKAWRPECLPSTSSLEGRPIDCGVMIS